MYDDFQKIKETKQFWLNLPHQFCNTISLTSPINETEQCWNGSSFAANRGYIHPQTKSLDGGSSILNEQTNILQDVTDKLRKAHLGQEVEIVDDTEESIIGGSGSGSGYGVELEVTNIYLFQVLYF